MNLLKISPESFKSAQSRSIMINNYCKDLFRSTEPKLRTHAHKRSHYKENKYSGASLRSFVESEKYYAAFKNNYEQID